MTHDLNAPDTPDKSGRDQAGKFMPGQSGNPSGRPRRARSRTVEATEKQLDGHAEKLIARAISIAMEGSNRDAAPMLRAFLPLLLPPLPSQPIQFEFPELKTAQDAVKAFDAIASALAKGEISESEMKILIGFLEQFLSALKVVEYEARIRELEQRMAQK